ncbi:hypothetical protein [Beijerinckia sp. L45]|uniref:hypothetical protein n=1 Tax=Beijerinckia sp. L45 TaxID=1641855 RepID=UPI00131E056C|nr:hypothetical protein [Beijerinckia sp. L45]
MPSIVLTPSAVDKLLNDKTARKVPFLGYYRRSYSTARDGTITEYGDGFALTTIDPDDGVETRDIVIKAVPVGNVFDILVGGGAETMAQSFTIGWSKKFTYEPLAS